ncbi:MAG TPA: hypothetical protein VKS01_11675 [Bryobacteraceae bacterium]|nr:hypothetical protein [Bryobacteraceae bacterium]
MNDNEFVRAFESCELPPEAFHHRDHIRMARIYLDRYGLDEATARFVESIRRYAVHLGKADKYHETITVAWMRILATEGDSPKLLDKDYLKHFYSPALLESAEARLRFVEPDLRGFGDGAADVLK